MPVLMLLLLVGTLLTLWLTRRGATLTRQCRWRLTQGVAAGAWRCATCGAEIALEAGAEPRHCRRPAL